MFVILESFSMIQRYFHKKKMLSAHYFNRKCITLRKIKSVVFHDLLIYLWFISVYDAFFTYRTYILAYIIFIFFNIFDQDARSPCPIIVRPKTEYWTSPFYLFSTINCFLIKKIFYFMVFCWWEPLSTFNATSHSEFTKSSSC